MAAEPKFERVQLTTEFHAEGGTAADLDNDGHGEVIVGPWIYWGPEYTERSRFYAGEPVDPAGYSKNFVMYNDDIDGDKLMDIVVLGFPGAESWWYRNPGKDKGRSGLWQQHVILDVTDNESPMLVDLDGDGVKDLVCASKGFYGYASHAGQDPTAMWKFTAISPNNNYHRFTHGLGVGDVNNDSRMDLMEKDGWWENPGPRSGDAAKEPWKFHKVTLAAPGGAQMYAVDLDGDGKNEIVTGTSAHGFGLVYYKVIDAAHDKLEKVEIMTADEKTSPVGIAISQLHGIDMGDINRDGIPDIITGKRWWAHGTGDEGSHMPSSLVWLETQRSGGRVRFVPHVVDVSSGVGTQIMATDVNQDKLLDIVCGNKRGAFLVLQIPADRPAGQTFVKGDRFEQQLAAESVAIADDVGGFRPALSGKQPLNFDFEEVVEASKAARLHRDWEVRGSMSASVISAARNQAHGKFMASSANAEGQHKPVGELISRPFVLTQPWLSALIGGGKNPKACVEVVSEASGLVLGRFPGTDGDGLERQWLDLKSHVGTPVRVRLVDHMPEGGSASLDDVRLHASK
ncbi:MAG: VCBS repeat-containing protein [Pirellulaceae bacterium]|nr:VCBS repeat-containing protein [Pirellulaceae bacterium]